MHLAKRIRVSWTNRENLEIGDELGLSGGVHVGADF